MGHDYKLLVTKIIWRGQPSLIICDPNGTSYQAHKVKQLAPKVVDLVEQPQDITSLGRSLGENVKTKKSKPLESPDNG